ncbi:MAG: hypothetical protein ACI828_000579 [Flavobacteriales bacterium]|jgi:hypothetical protein
MALHGHLIKWIELTGLMNRKLIIIAVFMLFFAFAKAQSGWRKDSLQFKVFTRLYINELKMVDSVKVQKIECDYCSQRQILGLGKEALHRTRLDIDNPKYSEKGVYQDAHYIRVSRADFLKLNN